MNSPSLHLAAAGEEASRLSEYYLHFFTWVLLGYALLGRGFAYLGYSPLYIGEICLALGIVAMLTCRAPFESFRLLPIKFLFALMVWCGIVTAINIPRYGIEALRDAVIWGYGMFALVIAAVLIDRPELFKQLLLRYRKFAVIFLCVMWFIFLGKRLGLLSLPQLPGSPTELGAGKGGDVMVHLAGVTAFLLVGMLRKRIIWYLFVGVIFIIGATITRGGLMAFLAAIVVIATLRPAHFKMTGILVGISSVMLLLALANPTITLKNREISLDQLLVNATSIVSETEEGNLDNTKEWRLSWWTQIISYTFKGEYFLAGKGFGVNLAETDGFLSQRKIAMGQSPNRNPHNAHMTMLARAGVPGFVLWLLVQASWFWFMLRAYIEARTVGELEWEGIFVFLIAYALACLVNATFDVFLEGPMGGIWFWSIFGVGSAALYLFYENRDWIRV